MRQSAAWLTRGRMVVLATGAALTLGGGILAATGTDAPSPARSPASLAQHLGPRTWALAIPISWLAAPIPGLRDDDVLDLIGTRAGERATASDVATGLRVISADDRVVVVELTDDDASAIAAARGRGLSLIPILRSGQ
jgi:hypothetical protein